MARRWHWLSDQIQKNGWKVGVELGVMDGKNIAYLCEHNPGLKMIGIDMWQKLPGLPRYDHIANKRSAELVASKYKGRVLLLETQTSGEVIASRMERKRGPLDFVFIDADHCYEAVKKDILAWKDKTSFLCGHDYGNTGVRQACSELLDAVPVGVDGCWYARP